MLIPRLPKTLVMPLQNGTQKEGNKGLQPSEIGLGPDFRRDDGRGRDDDDGKGSG